MSPNFLLFASDASPGPSINSRTEASLEPTPSDRESLRLLVIGSRHGVTTTIQTLHRLRFAEVSDWSPLLPAPTPGEVMSILTRTILLN